MRTVFALALLYACLCAAHFTTAADWPQFRGPDSGLSAEKDLPQEWSADKHVHWKVTVPGAAWSSPIVWGDRIFLTTAITDDPTWAKPGRFGGGGGERRGQFGRPENGGPPGGDRRGDGPGRDRGPRRDGDENANPGQGNDGGPARNEGPPAGNGQAGGEPSAEGAPPREGGQRGPGGFGRGGRRGGFGGGFGGGSPPDAKFNWEVLCLDRETGKTLWSKVAAEGKPPIPTHRTNTFASETPVTDGERLYVYFGMIGLFCYDLDGKPLWEKKLGVYPMMMGWGTGSSPALHGDLLYIQCDNEKESFLVALDKKTGEERWRQPRTEKSNWCSPYIWKNKLRTELVCGGGQEICSYDPESGKLLWQVKGLTGRCSATPVGDAERVYFGTGGGMGGAGPLVAVSATASGTIELPADGETPPPGIAWVVPRSGPPMASPMLYQGRLYVLDQRGGQIRCHDAATGELVFRDRLPEARSFTSSPWAYDGKVFCLDEDGQTFVIEAGPEFKLVGKNTLEERFWSSPAIAKGMLLLRGVDNLYCIE